MLTTISFERGMPLLVLFILLTRPSSLSVPLFPCLKDFLLLFCGVSLLVMNSFSFSVSGKAFSLHSFLKYIFLGKYIFAEMAVFSFLLLLAL